MTENHGHCHECSANTPEETAALLGYMISHNRHHTDELHELAHSVDGEARELIHSAIIGFESANAKLEKALKLITE